MKKISLILSLILMSFIAQANLIIVNSNQDVLAIDGNCTLRDAMTASNFDVAYDQCAKGSGDDLIWLLLGSTNESIQLSQQLPIIDGLEIQGPGAANLILFPSNSHNGNIFLINTDRDVTFKDFRIGAARSSAIEVINVDELEITNLQFLNNTAASQDDGGAIHANSRLTGRNINSITISNSIFRSNSADAGGAIAISGQYPVLIEDSLFELNTANTGGGAIHRANTNREIFNAEVTINNSQFKTNSSNSAGGVLLADTAYVKINESLFHQNEGQNVLFLTRSLSEVNNSLFAENQVSKAIVNRNFTGSQISAELSLSHNTFLNNQNLDVANTGTTLLDTYLKANVFAGPDAFSCEGINFSSLGYNLQALGATCPTIASDMTNTDPLLLPLGLYGGDVLLAPPSPISPLVDAAGTGCNNKDLSGEGRPRDGDGSGGLGQCDIGAVERPNAYGLSLSFTGDGDGEVSLPEFSMTCESPDACLWPLPRNETFSFQPAADTGSTFIQWGGSCSGDTTCDVTMSSFKFLSAEFASVNNPATLTISKTANGPDLNVNAVVTSSPAGILCGGACSAEFMVDDVINLTASPESGTVIELWLGCDSISGDQLTCTVTLAGNTTIELFMNSNTDIIFKDGFE